MSKTLFIKILNKKTKTWCSVYFVAEITARENGLMGHFTTGVSVLQDLLVNLLGTLAALDCHYRNGKNIWTGNIYFFMFCLFDKKAFLTKKHGIGVMLGRGCAVPGGRRARARVGRSRVGCIGVCAVSARAG